MDIKEATRKRLEELGISVEGLIALMNKPEETEAKPVPFNEGISEVALEIKVKNILHRLGGPSHIKGYQYATDAIVMAVCNRNFIDSVTKEIYPKVAEKNDTEPSRVERASRHFVEVSWSRSSEEDQRKIFGAAVSSIKGRPTNSEFIATIADYVRLGGE